MLAVLGDGLSAVLDGGDVDDGVAHGPCHLPRGGGGDPLAGLLRHRVAHWVAGGLDWLVGGDNRGVDNRGNHGNRGDHSSVVSFGIGFSLRLGFSFGFGFGLPPPANRGLGHTGLDEVGAGVDHGGGVGGSLGGLGARGRHHLAALLRHHHVLVQVEHGLAHLAWALNLAGLASLHWSQRAHWLGIA